MRVHPEPLELRNPELAETIRQVANGQHPTVAGITFMTGRQLYRLHTGQFKMHVTAARNDRCPCGSGKKFKKCCGYD